MPHSSVLGFLETLRDSHPDMGYIFTRGSCYRLYLLLRHVYPDAVAYTNLNHVVTRIGGRYVDINGEVDVAGQGYREMDERDHASQAPCRAFGRITAYI